MGIVDGVDLDLGARMAEPKLLEDFIVLVNVTCSLDQDVGFQTINLVADGNAKVFSRCYPWQWIATEDHWR